MTNGVNMIDLLNKVKELFVRDDIGIIYHDGDVIKAVRSIFQREVSQLQKMKKDVLENNKNYKLNVSQFYLNNKKNDIHIENLQQYLIYNKKLSKREVEYLDTRDLIKLSIQHTEIQDLDKNRIEKFIYEMEQIVDVFKLENPKKMDLLNEKNKNLFSDYVDSFVHGNKKIEEHLK